MPEEFKFVPVIAIDFDGTIVEHKFPEIGRLLPDAKRVINKWYDLGYKILIWTCRNNHEPDHPEWKHATVGDVRDFLIKNGIRFTGINQQHPDHFFYLESRKIFAHVYIDDRNLGGFPGWKIAERMVAKYFVDWNWSTYVSDVFNMTLSGEN